MKQCPVCESFLFDDSRMCPACFTAQAEEKPTNLQEAMLPHYVRLAFGGAVTMPDGLDYTYSDLATLAGNGREVTFAQFIEWASEYMDTAHQMRLELKF